jgi:hypothetical protein
MRSMCIAVVLFSFLAVGAAGVTAQSNLTGKWRTVFIPGESRNGGPKMFGEVLLDLKAEGKKLTGTATMGDGWPGSAPIQDGKIEGNRFSFTWTGAVPSSSGLPHLTFTGAVDGDQMTLSMDGDYGVKLKGERLPPK